MKYATWNLYTIILLQIYQREVKCAKSEEQEKFLLARNYNPHPPRRTEAPAASLINQSRNTKLGRNGPVLFPESSSPPPRTPFIVTARPRPQQINRADQQGSVLRSKPPTASNDVLNQYPDANFDQTRTNIYSNNYYNQPRRDYNDYSYSSGAAALQDIGVLGQSLSALQQANLALGLSNNSSRSVLERHPYAAVAKKIKTLTDNYGRPGFTSLEQRTVVPPIYNALDNYARTKVLKQRKKSGQNTASRRKASKAYKDQNSVPNDGVDDEYYNDNSGNEAKHYAFSYSVRDHYTGDDFSHSQRQSGSGTNGEYRVKLPDGRLQIVSYTADNGGYKAEVRYEEDNEAGNDNQPNQLTPSPPTRIEQVPVEDHKLGRIVVPSREYQEYPDEEFADYYDDENSKVVSQEPPREVLITSKPGYLHTTASTEPNLLYKQLIYHNTDGTKSSAYVMTTPAPLVYLQDDALNGNGQNVGKYMHYYDPSAVKFVSTTPKYELVDNSIATGGSAPSSTTGGYFDRQRGYFTASSTPAPGGVDIYDHLDTPDVNLKSKGGQVKYTSVSPLVYRVSQSTTPEPSYAIQGEIENGQRKTAQQTGGGNYYSLPIGNIDIGKYFTFTKR